MALSLARTQNNTQILANTHIHFVHTLRKREGERERERETEKARERIIKRER